MPITLPATVQDNQASQLNFEYLATSMNSAATAFRTGSLTLSTSGYNMILVDTIESAAWDPGGHMDLTNGWYRVPVTGQYWCTAQARVTVASTSTLGLILVLNGTGIAEGDIDTGVASGTGNWARTVSALVPANAGDHIQFYVYSNVTSNTLYVSPGFTDNRLCVARAF